MKKLSVRFLVAAVGVLSIFGALIMAHIKDTWNNEISLSFGAIGLVITLVAWLFPLSPQNTSSIKDNQSPKLVVKASGELADEVVYLLPSEYWRDLLAPERHFQAEVRYIEQQPGTPPTYGTSFTNLIPHLQYMFWGEHYQPMPITLAEKQVRQIVLPAPIQQRKNGQSESQQG